MLARPVVGAIASPKENTSTPRKACPRDRSGAGGTWDIDARGWMAKKQTRHTICNHLVREPLPQNIPSFFCPLGAATCECLYVAARPQQTSAMCWCCTLSFAEPREDPPITFQRVYYLPRGCCVSEFEFEFEFKFEFEFEFI